MLTGMTTPHRSTDSPQRRRAIDVARAGALLVVVVGHLALAVVDRPGGELRATNLLALRPGWAWIAVAAPMPVFFAAGGWANATTTLAASAVRLRRLVGLAAVVVVVWSAAVLVASLLTGDAGPLRGGARVATQPFWFLAAYVPLAAFGGPLARLAARRPVVSIGICLEFLALSDLARLGVREAECLGWIGFFVAWTVPWLAGAWWRDRYERGVFRERRTGLALLGGFGMAAAVLVWVGGYEVPLIDAVPGGRSNTSPPNLYTAVVAMAQVGVLMAVASALDGLYRRTRAFWDRMGALSVGVYVWHLSALALCVGLLALGLPAVDRLTTAWWLTRPFWYAAVLAATLGLVTATAAVARRLPHRQRAAGSARLPALGVLAATAAGAVAGLHGPVDAESAVAMTTLFVAAWWLFSPSLSAVVEEPCAGQLGDPVEGAGLLEEVGGTRHDLQAALPSE